MSVWLALVLCMVCGSAGFCLGGLMAGAKRAEECARCGKGVKKDG